MWPKFVLTAVLRMLTTHHWLSLLVLALHLPVHLGEAQESEGVQGYNILSLDGGGSRGVMETVILRQVEALHTMQ